LSTGAASILGKARRARDNKVRAAFLEFSFFRREMAHK
jgi:hypothetical protein